MSKLYVQNESYHENLESASTRPGTLPLEDIDKDLQEGANVVDVAKKYGLLADEEEEEHLREDWYNENGNGWWPDFDTAEIVRQSNRELIRLYGERPRRVRTIWVSGGDDFAIVIDDTNEQITRIILTPRVPVEGVPEDGPPLLVQQEASGVQKQRPLRKGVKRKPRP